MNTATTAPVITEALEVATEHGARPFAGYVRVVPNAWGGVDISNPNDGETLRLTGDDGEITLRVLRNGSGEGSQTFTGRLANAGTIGAALASLL